MGLMEKLFNKSEEELKKLGEGMDTPTPPPEQPPAKAEMSDEDKAIMERIKKFREEGGRKPDGTKRSSQVVDDDMELFAEGLDPAFEPLTNGEAADPVEEQQLADVVTNATNFIFSESMPDVIRAMKAKPDFFEGAAETAFQILNKERNRLEARGEEVEPAVFISQTGAPSIIMGALVEVAQKAGIPGSDDQNQYAAAVINLYRKMGENIIEKGDDNAISEAENLAASMAFAGAQGAEKAPPKQNKVAQGVSTALLGAV